MVMNGDCFDDGRLSYSDIAIIGGGCSGVLTAAGILRAGGRGALTIIEPRAFLGRGLAYSTPYREHLLNVPAGGMSAFPDKPSDFVDWLRNQEWPGAGPSVFAPRHLYGEYLEHALISETLRNNRGADLKHVRAEVVKIAVEREYAVLDLSDSSRLGARRVVLALGNPASSPSVSGAVLPGLEDSCHPSPWLQDSLRVRRTSERILVLGTGLTAVDSALALFGQGMDCRVWMLSKRGILPQVHRPSPAAGVLPLPPLEGHSLGHILREVRAQIRNLREAGRCWRTVVDALRPISNQLWSQLPLRDRKRYARHLKTYWENHRHRMAPEIFERIESCWKSGVLHVSAGRLLRAVPCEDAIEVRIQRRGEEVTTLMVDRIINCTGIEERYAESPRPLIRTIVATGLGKPNDLGTGFLTDEHGGLIDSAGRASPVLFTLGPPRRGQLFETTAVPEIRSQAAALAQHLSVNARSGMRTRLANEQD